jgi:transglutaminase-like putative cysteine protease
MTTFRQSRTLSNIPLLPLVGMIVALVLATIPFTEKVAGWVIAAFAATCIARLILNRPGARLPSFPLKIVLFAAGVGGVALTYGTAVGVDPGFSILLVLVSLKLIETNTSRDFHVLGVLGFFLVLCDLFFSQDLIRWLYIAATLLLLLTSLIIFHRNSATARIGAPFRLALVLFAQALPIAVLLFLVFPRFYGGFRFQFSQSLLSSSGMSEELSPGGISSLVLNDDIAFRVDFPDGNMPSMPSMYWRGGVLWFGNGLRWTKGPLLQRELRPGKLMGPSVRQRITLQPHGGKWLFALDRPASDVHDAVYLPGSVLESKRVINNRFHYEVISRPGDHELFLPADQRVAALDIPFRLPPRVQALVDSWKPRQASPQQIVDSARRFFRQGHFVYTLQPGSYSESPAALEEFLFQRQRGFCEHYAAAFATLMRAAGLPSRVIIGYHGGEFNNLGKYVIVRQSDAHAWCEVWIKDSGWLRMDPTDLIAPDSLTSSLASYLERNGAQANAAMSRQGLAFNGLRDLQHELQLLWDNVNYQWDLRVLNFDEEAQHNFLFSLGLNTLSWAGIFLWFLVVVAAFSALLCLWLGRPLRYSISGSREGDRIARAYARFCRVFARAGLPREPWEGPQQFGARAARRFPNQAAAIERIAELYVNLRYGPAPESPQAFFRAVRTMPRLKQEANRN